MTIDPFSEIQNPETSAQRLSELAAAHPELGPWIAAHPNSYPALRQWIATYATPAQPQPPTQPMTQASPAAAAPVPVSAAPAAATASAPTAAQAPLAHGTPTASEVAPTPTPVRKKKRKGLILGLAIGLAAVLVIGGGGIWWFLASRLGGAPTPEAAFSKLISGAKDVDALALYGSLAPSEVSAFREPIQKLMDARPGSGDGVDISKLLSDLHSELHVETKDLAFGTENLTDGVARVTWTGGEIVVDGDPQRVAEKVTDAYAPLIRSQYTQYGYSDADIDEMIAEQKDRLADELDLPYSLTPAEYADSNGQPAALVMVEEGSGWYVSPMLSIADASYQRGGAKASLGSTVAAATPFGTPEEAASGLAQAFTTGDLDEVAAALPLAERRLVSLYGPTIWNESSKEDMANLEVTQSDFHTDSVSGDRARVLIDHLTLSWGRFDRDVGRDLTSELTVSGTCADWSSEYAYDDGDFSLSRGWVEKWVVKTTKDTGCLSDTPLFTRLGLDRTALIAVKEDGGWLVSPIGTVGDAVTIATENFLPYYENGTLDQLFD